LLFDNLYTAIEAFEIFHSFFLDLNRPNGGWWFHFGFEPAVHPGCFRWWALTSSYSESRSFSLWTTGKALFLYLRPNNILSWTLNTTVRVYENQDQAPLKWGILESKVGNVNHWKTNHGWLNINPWFFFHFINYSL
jgi:hypothetical protein